jgi:alkanesulfonate monooxygenase SsuD/methylene tetrahydromethanopterin reductase-like flavin-dependent oxidoreductase (luciferase family)
MAGVEFGIHAGPQDIKLDELRKLWRYCDEKGIDLITTWDHFYESPPRDGNGPCFEALACLSAMAVETSRSRIGCLCFGIGYRNPAMLAKALTTIDHLSHGRLTVGLGAGWHVPEHEGYGFPLPPIKDRMDRLDEGVQVVRAMFTNARSSFEGSFFRLKDAANIPPPVQPRVPIIVGGTGERRNFAIAARLADGSNQGYLTPEVYGHKNEVLDRWCETFNRDPRSLERSCLVHFNLTSKGEAAPRDGAIYGTTRQVIDQVGAYVQAGAQRISAAIRPPLDWDAIGAFVENVIPAFR